MENAVATAPITLPGRKLQARLVGVYAAGDAGDLTSVPVSELQLELGGVTGDRHHGFTRKAGSREPWYPRGTEIRSGRQVTIVSIEEMAEVARRLGLPRLPPEWIGANLAVEGIPDLSHLPPGTRLHFEGNVALVVEAINAPCRDAGRCIARHTGGRAEFELMFPKEGTGRRGVVASVERAGIIRPGTEINVRIPQQRLYV